MLLAGWGCADATDTLPSSSLGVPSFPIDIDPIWPSSSPGFFGPVQVTIFRETSGPDATMPGECLWSCLWVFSGLGKVWLLES